MDRVDHLRRSRESSASVWQQFILQYERRANSVHAFFEGRDDRCVYLSELKKRFRDKYTVFSIVCDGKDGVIAAYKRIAPSVRNKRRILFFVDKDLDNFLDKARKRIPNSKSIFSTRYYSIDNYYVTEEMIGDIVETLWAINQSSHEYRFSRVFFRNSYNQFCNEMIPIMAWCISRMRRGQKIHFKNIRMNSLVDITLDGDVERKRNRLLELERACQDEVDEEFWPDVKICMRQLRMLDAKTFIRGKFELWFLVQLLDKLSAQLARLSNSKKLRVRTQLHQENVVEVLTQFLVFPAEFDEFIDYQLSRI